MMRIYEAANLIDAQLAMDELRAGGLHVVMKGQYLSGGIGELPPTGLVSLWVSPLQEDRARDLIVDYEQSRQTENAPVNCSGCGEVIEGNFSHCWSCGGFL